MSVYDAVEYRMIIQKDGDVFVAWSPDLPGCIAEGDTPTEVVVALHDAMEAWLEASSEQGQSIPPPAPFPDDIWPKGARIDGGAK